MKQYIIAGVFLIMAAISYLLHAPHFKKDLVGKHVWRQTQTQTNIDNFYEKDMNILNPRVNNRKNGDGIFRMEFPLMQWMIAASYHFTGQDIYITRLWMFFIGLSTAAGVYILLRSLLRKRLAALMGAWAFYWSPMIYYYTINPLPDNMALCFSIWGLALFAQWNNRQQDKLLVLSGLCLSIGALCKLPFIIYYIVPIIYFINLIRQDGYNAEWLKKTSLYFSFALLSVCWYAWVISGWKGNGIVGGLIESETPFSVILGYIYYHIISTLPERMLNYGSLLFFLAGFAFLYQSNVRTSKWYGPYLGLCLLITAYVLFEINMIEKVHDYYLYPFYPLLFILVALGAIKIFKSTLAGRVITIALLTILPLTAYLRNAHSWDIETPGFNKDLLTYKSELRSAIPDTALCIVGNDISNYIFFYYIHKKGWSFANDNFTATQFHDAIMKGAKYLYSDSRTIDENESIQPMLEKLIATKGTIRIYKLAASNK